MKATTEKVCTTKKDGCPDVHFTWEKVAKRITDLIQKGRYLTEQEQAEYDKIQAEKALAEEDALQAQQPDPAVWEYNGVKERHPDDIILYQMGDFFELYGEDAKTAAAELDLNLTTRAIPGGGRVEMCGFPANRLEQVVEQLRDKHDVTISAVPKGGRERQEYSMPLSTMRRNSTSMPRKRSLAQTGPEYFRRPKQPQPLRFENCMSNTSPLYLPLLWKMCHIAMPAVTVTMRTP